MIRDQGIRVISLEMLRSREMPHSRKYHTELFMSVLPMIRRNLSGRFSGVPDRASIVIFADQRDVHLVDEAELSPVLEQGEILRHWLAPEPDDHESIPVYVVEDTMITEFRISLPGGRTVKPLLA